MNIQPGDRVGARRWPYAAAHPDCWSAPHGGTVLALNDPLAWVGSIAFGDRVPTLTEVTQHVQRVRHLYPTAFENSTPVAWDFGKVYWEKTDRLTSEAEDRAAWALARGFAVLALAPAAEARVAC